MPRGGAGLMSLVKTSLLNGIAVAVKLASALVLNKILAIYVGPAGYAVIGQFQNVLSIVVNLAGGVLVTGVTKSTAEHFDDAARQHAVWRTAIRLSLLAALGAGALLFVWRDALAARLLQGTEMAPVFVWLALTLPAMAANNLLLAIVNGKKEVGVYVAANLIGSVVTIAVTGLLAWRFGLYGTLVALTINPAIALLSTAAIVARRDWLRARFLWGRMEKPVLRELSGFALMGLTSALTVPITFMLIRDHLASRLGLPAAGYWQASWKISEIYLMLVTTTLSVYYLPRLAEIRTAVELRREIVKVYRFVLPVVIAGALTIYVLRDFIVQTLFTADFLPMRALFGWQLAGDVIKIGAWILAYIMLGRSLVKVFVVTEVLFAASFVGLNWVLVGRFGLVGVAMAYAANYVAYWLTMGFVVRNEMRKMESGHAK